MKEKTNLSYSVRPLVSMRDLVQSSCRLYADRPAFLYWAAGGVVTVHYREVYEEILAFTSYLHEQGLSGKRIALIGKNCYGWALSYLTVLSGVGSIVPLDKDLRADEVASLVRDSEAAAIIYTHEEEQKVAPLAEECKLIALDEIDLFLGRGRELRREGDRSFEKHTVDPTALSILLYTSGTTGVGKGVMLSQYNICSNIMAVRSRIDLGPQDRSLSMLPLHHTFECMAGFLTFFYSGASIAYNRSLKTLQADLSIFSPTVLVCVPLVLETFYSAVSRKYKKMKGGEALMRTQFALAKTLPSASARRKLFSTVSAAFGGKLTRILVGAAPLPPHIFEAYERFGYRVYLGYGLTETSPVITVHDDWYHSANDVGFPLPGQTVIIDGPDEEGVGELCVCGPNVMLGYYHDPEQTAQVLKDGFFHTGDLAQKLPNGAYRICGRRKSMIVAKNGKKIFPEELEHFLNQSSLIEESLVYEGKDGSVTVSVYPNEAEALRLLGTEQKPPEKEYLDAVAPLVKKEVARVNAMFPSYKAMTRIVLRTENFVRTTTQKIKRKEAENYREEYIV